MPKYRTQPSNVSAVSASNRLTRTLRLSLATCLATATVAIPASTYAQEAAATSGTITGRVQNAASGKYLGNARVDVVGTQIQGFTDEYGEFQLNDVPVGSYKLKVFYTGLDSKEVSVEVRAGEILAKEITLTSADAYGTGDDTVKLEAFVVSSAREREAAALAINEQRFAGNIKSVVSTEAFGEIAEGNVGEFMKYIPGITIDYVAADARSAGLNGLDASFTTVSFNGNRLASAASGGVGRTFEFESATISSASRIEVTKLPTPETSAEGLAGSINLVPKNAFEHAKEKLSINAYLGMHNEELSFRKEGGIGGEKQFFSLPNLSFSYVNPLSKTLGFTISGQSSNQFTDQHRTAPTWNWGQGGGSVTNPIMTGYTLQDGPKISYREGLSGRIDWKFLPGHVISFSAGTNYYATEFNNRNINFTPGTTTATFVQGGTGNSFGPSFTQSASGQGAVTHGQSFRDKATVTNNFDITYRFKGRLWEVDSSLYASNSRGWYPLKTFESLNVSMVNPDTATSVLVTNNTTNVTALQTRVNVRYESDGSPFPAPDRFFVTGTNGTVIDPFKLSSYRVNSARIRPQKGEDTFSGVNFKVKRHLDFLPFYSSIKVGGEIREQIRNVRAWQEDLNFTATDKNAAQFLDRNYNNADNGFGFSNIEWPDPYAAWAAYQANPALFVANTGQQEAARRFYLQNSQYITETVTSGFIQQDVKLIDNRLSLVYGVRYEKTEDEGKGLKINGQGNNLANIAANWRERGQNVTKDYDGYYPSINSSFTLTENTIIRAGYAKSFGRPNFVNIIPLTRVNDTNAVENDSIGNINAYTALVRNTGLKPYEADNYDVTVEHYLPKAGLASVRGFVKDVTGFFVDSKRSITSADIAAFNIEAAEGATLLANSGQIETTENASKPARLAGFELTYRIAELPYIPASIGKLGFYASYTRQRTTGAGQDEFTQFARELGNARLNYSKGNFQSAIGVNYTTRRKVTKGYLGSTTSNDRYGTANNLFVEFIPRRIVIDVSADYRLDKRWSLFANVRNITNEANSIQEVYNDFSPDYSHVNRFEQYGVLINVGVKAEF
ncbi:TonB-dependent receptor domain-containing protein [Nibricoccus aquaticus]|nr:TonB-dependent receptor [Nibricoccus aquaticus]